MSAPPPTGCLLPGLGADHRLFSAQLAAFPMLAVPAWPAPAPDDDLPRYAVRVASALSGKPALLGGASFGGFVAWELAHLLRPTTLLLLGSASSLDALRAPLRATLPLAGTAATWGLHALQRLAPVAAALFGAQSNEQRELFCEMLRAASPRFMAWATAALRHWRPRELPSSTRLLRIHGSRDHIIAPPPHVACELVEGAGRLITMSHPSEVNRFLARALHDCASAACTARGVPHEQ